MGHGGSWVSKPPTTIGVGRPGGQETFGVKEKVQGGFKLIGVHRTAFSLKVGKKTRKVR